MSFVVNVEEGAEQSVAAGDKHPEPVDELGVGLKIPIRNYANETNYRYGITAGAPRVMGLLDTVWFQMHIHGRGGCTGAGARSCASDCSGGP